MRSDYDFITHLTRFCRLLRSHGLLIGPLETADAVRVAGIVDLMDRGRVYWSLRSVLLSRHEEAGIFDQLFERFWNFEPIPGRPAVESASSPAG